MADKVSQLLWERLQAGTAPRQQPEPKTDATTLALLRQARGDTDYSHIHESNAKGRAEHQAAVQRRARALQVQHGLSWTFAEARALREMDVERRASAERDHQRAVYDQMVKNNREEMEANSTPALEERVKAATEERRDERAERQFRKLLAEIRATS